MNRADMNFKAEDPEWNEMKNYNFWDEEHHHCSVTAGQDIAHH